jgi:hypothetical protein
MTVKLTELEFLNYLERLRYFGEAELIERIKKETTSPSAVIKNFFSLYSASTDSTTPGKSLFNSPMNTKKTNFSALVSPQKEKTHRASVGRKSTKIHWDDTMNYELLRKPNIFLSEEEGNNLNHLEGPSNPSNPHIINRK